MDVGDSSRLVLLLLLLPALLPLSFLILPLSSGAAETPPFLPHYYLVPYVQTPPFSPSLPSSLCPVNAQTASSSPPHPGYFQGRAQGTPSKLSDR
ncbi:hypothetical protein EJ06DRAFT_532774 [Trichodelitschia bisporula]|uniref:Uncharacterized protein n=1 Tax=Trichodelitschia bisporula TaxID=703511 RepID=A0A6G1HPI0_9PEZI|nr:hypothetical protein EJ06DRAFT_532774 [Trichodelitschia bisporula]